MILALIQVYIFNSKEKTFLVYVFAKFRANDNILRTVIQSVTKSTRVLIENYYMESLVYDDYMIIT